MFKKILIANRGEVAIRIIRACKDLGISTVAVHVPGEENSLHVRMADEVIAMPERRDYLNVERILEVARKTGADALHPGYGFLSENPSFVEACENNGITYIGPNAESIRQMGVKSVARQIAQRIGVPVLPGTGSVGTDDPVSIAKSIGFPVLVKAAHGGGGRGIRPAYTEQELLEALASGEREAQMAFDSGELYIEKFLESPRHIEVQVLCDKYGNRVALGERECSIQRRRQKLLEEGPSIAVDENLRKRFQDAAVKIANEIDYVGAGTVEFLLSSDGSFYFMEMNTRIQVEHGVTELLTNTDLVKEQIRIAAGQPMDLRPRQGQLEGWAIECRIVAEDPAKQFRPSPGQITNLQVPNGPWVRWDSDLYHGAKVTPMFDSMIGKLLVWGRDRTEAIARMRRALDELTIEGIHTTVPLMRSIMVDPLFCEGQTSISYLDNRLEILLNK